MNKSEEPTPDERAWRKAFEDASEMPPPRVWAQIERRLDESEGTKIVPLWGLGLTSLSVVRWSAGIAAGLTLLLGGWWLARSPEPTTAPAVSAVAPIVPSRDPAVAVTKSAPALASSPATIADPRTLAGRSQPVRRQLANASEIVQPRHGTNRTLALTHQTPVRQRSAKSAESVRNAGSGAVTALTMPVRQRPVLAGQAQNEQPVLAPEALAAGEPAFRVLHNLRGRPFRHPSDVAIQRIVWVAPVSDVRMPAQPHTARRVRAAWVSAAVMPAAFNPSVALRPAVPTLPTTNGVYVQNVALVNQPTISSRPDVSVAYQVGAGLQVGERWSVESGVGYLSGRSTVVTPTATPVALVAGPALNSVASADRVISTLYTDALAGKLYTNQAISQPADYLAANQYGLSARYYNANATQTLTNDYQYVQVPMQVGYQLRPRKRLNLSLLGGFLTNLFVRNTVGSEVVVTARDGVYRPVSWAATMGVRVRYRPTKRWSASLAGVYQPSLGVGTRADAHVLSRPTTSGISFGLDYHFE